eukprot:TRINITY_DN676_c0_g1_i1.p1 TRINITY_DN676_c0_g1~~TRINITY_DN676_c0_g1_i1.p1  ORF type:complete len:621 (-),score=67.18 TRINITY_DN676_c0_g1_i1:457-2319(-)
MFSWWSKPKGPDFGNPEALTNEERLSRMLHNPKASRTASTSTPVFEHFVIMGFQPTFPLPPLPSSTSTTASTSTAHIEVHTPLEPSLLYQYPQDVTIEIPNLPTFCFPKGVEWRKVNRSTQKEVDLLNILYNQESHLNHLEDQFVFLLTTEDEQVMYGICIYKEEVINNKTIEKWDTLRERVSYIQLIEQSMQGPDIILAKRCYCFLSRFPFFKLHFAVLNNILALEYSGNTSVYKDSRPMSASSDARLQMKTPNKNNKNHEYEQPLDSPPTNSKSRSTLRVVSQIDDSKSGTGAGDVRMRSKSIHTSSPTSSSFLMNIYPSTADDFYDCSNTAENILSRYRKCTVPPPGNTLSFRSAPDLPTIQFKRPTLDEEENVLCEYSLPILFYELSRENFYTLLSCVLLEKKICIYCENLRVLSSVVLSWITLIRPFVYQSIIIPLLPCSLNTMLDSPVPFIIGTPSLPPKSEIPPDVIVVDVEKDKLYWKDIRVLPRLPRFKEFESRFRPIHMDIIRELSPDVRPIPYQSSHTMLRMVEEICLVTQSYFMSLFSDFHKHCIREVTDSNNPITVFLKESYLAQTPKQDQGWLKEFFQTQTFFAYSDKRLRSSDEKERERRNSSVT